MPTTGIIARWSASWSNTSEVPRRMAVAATAPHHGPGSVGFKESVSAVSQRRVIQQSALPCDVKTICRNRGGTAMSAPSANGGPPSDAIRGSRRDQECGLGCPAVQEMHGTQRIIRQRQRPRAALRSA